MWTGKGKYSVNEEPEKTGNARELEGAWRGADSGLGASVALPVK